MVIVPDGTFVLCAWLQFSRWIKPGSIPILTDASCEAGLVTVYQPKLQRLVLVATNELPRALDLTFYITEFSAVNGTTATVQVYRTSELENHQNADVFYQPIPGYMPRVVAAKSVTTYLIFGVALTSTISSRDPTTLAP